MGYYSNVALCLTKNGMDQLKTVLAEAEKNNPDNFAAIKILIGDEPSRTDERTGAVVFLWEGERWYNEFDEIAFVEEFMDNLPHEDFLFIRLGEDYDDIETRGNFCGTPFNISVERKIIAG
ncbi:hypothetical protein [Desulfovibrio desulfuricans]|uniref:hypothetical protein n=1 Tax=Desulfovibrio desulfuricans TaxID=876 RepID=UPI001AE9DBAE|nr:hypothetical protein [Desulfovibrio desulfuricans]MDD3684153.1 hypothetical protein [Desulfovibrio desulfuricans]QTO39907.1 hypothetical protein J8J02_12495 [Desulfovibrio desulfuricans]